MSLSKATEVMRDIISEIANPESLLGKSPDSWEFQTAIKRAAKKLSLERELASAQETIRLFCM